MNWPEFLTNECQKEYPNYIIIYECPQFETWLKRQTVEHVLYLVHVWEKKWSFTNNQNK